MTTYKKELRKLNNECALMILVTLFWFALAVAALFIPYSNILIIRISISIFFLIGYFFTLFGTISLYLSRKEDAKEAVKEKNTSYRLKQWYNQQ